MAEPIVEISTGKIKGYEREGVYIFKGIPYGGRTDGTRRFLPPTKPEPWKGVREALQFGPRCFQTSGGISQVVAQARIWPAFKRVEPESENCLYLNIWTPAIGDGRKRPILFWCHGGGFFQGSGADPRTDGTRLAKDGDVVVITVNHRLGPLGFLYLGEWADGEFSRSGNAGMLDLVLALEWVQENIEVFGGDPNNVTIFGCSGGGGKVSTLMAMPRAKGLFHKAVIQSAYGLRMSTPEDAWKTTERILHHLGLKTSQIKALQDVPVGQLWEAYHKAVNWQPEKFARQGRHIALSPVVDGHDLPQHPFDPHASPLSADVPLLTGTTKDEATLFLLSDPQLDSIDEKGMHKWLSLYFGDNAQSVLDSYRHIYSELSPNDLLIKILSDRITIKDSITLAERKVAQNGAKVFMYQFAWESPVRGGIMKAMHGLEVPFVFQNVHVVPHLTGEGPEVLALAKKISRAWVQFAWCGNPGHQGLPPWPPYTLEERATMIFDRKCKLVYGQ